MARAFGYNCAWIAARTDLPLTVATALGLRKVRPSSWEAGIEAAYGTTAYSRHAFLSPPIDGWVLCASTAFFKLAEGQRDLPSFLPSLSRQLGTEVQCFLTYHVVEIHVWGSAENATLTRLYGFIGERGATLFDIGGQTDAEVSLGFRFFNERSPEASDPKIDYWAREDLTIPNEAHVMRLAGKWSIDPTTLDGQELDDGWVGEVD